MFLKNLSACCGGGAVLSSSVTPGHGVRSRREGKFERRGWRLVRGHSYRIFVRGCTGMMLLSAETSFNCGSDDGICARLLRICR